MSTSSAGASSAFDKVMDYSLWNLDPDGALSASWVGYGYTGDPFTRPLDIIIEDNSNDIRIIANYESQNVRPRFGWQKAALQFVPGLSL